MMISILLPSNNDNKHIDDNDNSSGRAQR